MTKRIKNIRIFFIICLLICVLLPGCSEKTNADNGDEANGTDSSLPASSDTQQPTDETNETEPPVDIDIDLTAMTPDMAFSELKNITSDPLDYEGQVIKIRGSYMPLYYQASGKYYHLLKLYDSTGAYTQVIEFVWGDDSHIFPDEYPAENADIEICGILKTYTEAGSDSMYCHILTDDIVVY